VSNEEAATEYSEVKVSMPSLLAQELVSLGIG
jgi:hypothetical protein